ncbi:MAG: DUF5615 family PIN-like protein [Thiohalocapsa sp.]
MRVLCDGHISYRLVNRLRELGVDATHMNRILDGIVWAVVSASLRAIRPRFLYAWPPSGYASA